MKKSIIPVAAFIAGMAIVPSVFAAGNGDNTTRYVRWGGAEGAVSDCLKSDAETCKLDAGDFDFNVADSNVATITKSKVLDLNGHTLTHEDKLGAVLLSVAGKGVTLTIQNGTIDMQGLDWATVSVSDGASLVIADNATIKATTPVSTHDAKKVTINGKLVKTVEHDTSALNVEGANTEVVINGEVASETANAAYTQTSGKATIAGKVVNENGNAINLLSGNLTLNGAYINAKGAAIATDGFGAIVINDCSEVVAEDSAIFFGDNAHGEKLTIDSSTVKSTEGSVFAKDDVAATVDEVVINNSRLESNADKTIKENGITFTSYKYDGATQGNVQLSDTKGSYGTLAAVCGGGAAADEENKGDDAENPNTADTIATYLTIATVALLGLGATAFVAKKSNR